MTVRFIAIWHDRGAILAKAARDDEDAAFDIAERSESAREFQTRTQATAFLKKLIREGRDFFGQGEIREIEQVEARCSACTCRGWQVRRYIQVDDEGECGETTAESECI